MSVNTVHEQERRTVARLEHAHSKRRVSQANASAGDLHPACGKQTPLGHLERCYWVLGCALGHRSPGIRRAGRWTVTSARLSRERASGSVERSDLLVDDSRAVRFRPGSLKARTARVHPRPLVHWHTLRGQQCRARPRQRPPVLLFATCASHGVAGRAARKTRRRGVARFHECRAHPTGSCRTYPETPKFREQV